MNNHGAILDDFGMEAFMAELMRACVQPLALAAGFADVLGAGATLQTHHAFVVAYALGKVRARMQSPSNLPSCQGPRP